VALMMTTLPTRAPLSHQTSERRHPVRPTTVQDECPDCYLTVDHEVIDDTGTHLVLECSRSGCSHRWETPWADREAATC
jgi:hypothetical protein